MKVVFKILKWIAIVVVIIFVITLFLPSKNHVERSRVIKVDVPLVYNLVNDLHLWKSWSPWYRMDTAATMEYFGSGIGKGSSYTWATKNGKVGKGKMEITDNKENESIDADLFFDGQGTSKVKYVFVKEPDGTKVTWNMDSDVKDVPMMMRPISKVFYLCMDKMIGPDFEQGLKNLDSVAMSIKH